MNYSYSRISGYFTCARSWWHRYVNNTPTKKKIFADDALICGSAMHHCIQDGVDEGLSYYEKQFNNYIGDRHINEELKFIHFGTPLNDFFGEHQHEIKLKSDDGFVGFIDDYDETTKTVIDFKYSNNRSYLTSPQIHLYKYFGEQQGLEIDKLGFLFVPKVAIRQRKTETLDTFRERLMETMMSKTPEFIEIPYNEVKIYNFMRDKEIVEDVYNNHSDEIEYFPCDPDKKFCRFCDYQYYCIIQKYGINDGKDIECEDLY